MTEDNIIGTDISLDVCKSEGYFMMDTEGDKELDPEKQYRVFCYYPEHVKEDLGNEPAIDTTYSWKEAKERYLENKKGIDSFADDMPAKMILEHPDFIDLLHAVDTINAYCGL